MWRDLIFFFKTQGNAGRVELGKGPENTVGSCPLEDSNKKRVPNLYACTFVQVLHT